MVFIQEVQVDRSSAPVAPRPSHRGGFLGSLRREHILQVRLLGELSATTFSQLDRSVLQSCQGDRTLFVLLDASKLGHMSLELASALVERERSWRRSGAVAVWVGLSDYLASLLKLACGGEHLPSLPSTSQALLAIDPVAGLPPSVARGRLEAWDVLRL